MAYGDISLKTHRAFAYPFIETLKGAKVRGNYWLFVHDDFEGPSGQYYKNLCVRTFEVDPDAKTLSGQIDFFEQYYAGNWYGPSYCCMYAREGIALTFGTGGTISILVDSSGIVTGIGDSTGPSGVYNGVNLDEDNGIVAFVSGSTLYTMSVSATGQLAVIDSLSLGMGGSIIRHLTGNIYAINCSGTITTVTISNAGAIGSIIDQTLVTTSWAKNSVTGFSVLGNGRSVIVGEDGSNDGWMTSFAIDDDGYVDNSSNYNVEYEGADVYSWPACESGSTDGDGNSYVFIFLCDSGHDIQCNSYKIASNGSISSADVYESGGSYYSSWMTKASYNLFVGTCDRTSTYVGDIWLMEMEGIPPPSISSITPDEGKRTRTYDIVISGTNFGGSTGVDFGSGITVDAFAVIDSTEAHVTITIDDDAAEGYYDLTIENPNGNDTLLNAFYVITTEDHYSVQISGLRIPYIDEDGGNQLHVVLENLSPTSKNQGVDGEIVIDIGYEVAG